MNKKIILNDNKGFSLVELIVSVLITAILMLSVGLFMTTSRSAYQSVNTSATLQEEAMTVERVVSEALMEAKKYGHTDSLDGVTGTPEVLWVKARDNESPTGDSIYFFVLDKSNDPDGKPYNTLRYCKADTSCVNDVGDILEGGKNAINANCFGTNKNFSIVARYVDSMSYSPKTRSDGNDLVCMEFEFTYLDKTYTKTLTVVTRNKTHTPITTVPAVPTTDPTVTTGP